MSSFYYLACFLLLTSQRSLASYPTPIVEEAPAVAVTPQPIHVEPIHVAHIAPAPAPIVAPVEFVKPAPVIASAPVVAPAPIVAPAPVVAPAPIHHHHPRTEIRNIAKSYKRVSGHRSDTIMVSGDDHHFAGGLELYPHHLHGDLLGEAAYPVPLRKQKLAAKKAARAHKSFEKKKN
ncbi:hypothetical protein ANCCAN_04734 [Ancylostoma caninum]|uniref:Uncharacterized protein n=1 Tax=Ancylostoma caninum TaxID=29170 RepID=A0A368GXS7_ANCCA|nr:hypothetical protein ANCCAN_04734 [Ancylostoma caninum]